MTSFGAVGLKDNVGDSQRTRDLHFHLIFCFVLLNNVLLSSLVTRVRNYLNVSKVSIHDHIQQNKMSRLYQYMYQYMYLNFELGNLILD